MGGRILVVDDDREICDSVSEVFKALGHDVQVAHSVHGALELVRRDAYRVVLLDYHLPDGDGVSLYQRMQQIRSGTSAVLVTGSVSKENTVAAVAAGVHLVLSKPVDFDHLVTVVKRLLGEKTADRWKTIVG